MVDEIVTTYFSTAQGNYVFDAYFSINHESNLTITEHPIQTGASISDHAYMEAQQVTFEIGMSDVMQDISATSVATFNGTSSSRSVNAYKILRKLQADRIPINATTRLGTYNNMLIETISAPDDNKTLYGLKATVVLKEIFVVSVTTVKISERPHKSESTNEGDQKVQEADESMLSSFLNYN
jgi:hypothetical protein